MAKILDNMTEHCDDVYECRCKIAELKHKKIVLRSTAWRDATGTAKEKEDYVKSEVASLDEEIAKYEAKIERYNGLSKILQLKLEYGDE